MSSAQNTHSCAACSCQSIHLFEPTSTVVKRDPCRGEYTAHGLVDPSIVVAKEVDSVVATINTSVWPLTTEEVKTQLHSMDLSAIATVVVELLRVHPVLEHTDGVMDNKARCLTLRRWSGHRALLIHPFEPRARRIHLLCVCIFCFGITLYPKVIDGQTNLELDPRIRSCTVVLLSLRMSTPRWCFSNHAPFSVWIGSSTCVTRGVTFCLPRYK